MLEELIGIHTRVITSTPTHLKRYLYSQINWNSRGLCILGDRGVGKTTLLCQDLLQRYKTPEYALYISADHVAVTALGLWQIAHQFFSYGGRALYIDEVHKYPNWSTEIKNILDSHKECQIIFSASSFIDLNKSKADLSRRVVYHRLLGLSFREYLSLAHKIDVGTFSFSEILHQHIAIASQFGSMPILKYFKEYLQHGYYPFFLEGLEDYFSKLMNVIEKVIFEDVAVTYHLKQTTLPLLKRILWLVATSNGLIPNIDKMSKNLGASREIVYNCLEYLNRSGLLNDLFPMGKGNAMIRKPGKIYLNNSNLLNTIRGSLKLEDGIGAARETFFVNQVSSLHKVNLPDKGDFIVDDTWIMEVGGTGKTSQQIKGEQDAFLVVDGTPIGFKNRIPLYLFGLLY